MFLINSFFNFLSTENQILLQDTELIIAVKYGDFKKIRLLVDVLNVNSTNYYGQTPLMFAAGNGNYKISKTLIRSGANVNLISDNGYTALMHASEGGHFEIVKLLVDNAADILLENNQGENVIHLLQKYLYLNRGENINASYWNTLNFLLLSKRGAKENAKQISKFFQAGSV